VFDPIDIDTYTPPYGTLHLEPHLGRLPLISGRTQCDWCSWPKGLSTPNYHGLVERTQIYLRYESDKQVEGTVAFRNREVVFDLANALPGPTDGPSNGIIQLVFTTSNGMLFVAPELGNIRDADLLDEIVFTVDNDATLTFHDVEVLLNGACLAYLPLPEHPGAIVVDRSNPLDLTGFIRQARINALRLEPPTYLRSILSIAADDWLQAWSPKYGAPWPPRSGHEDPPGPAPWSTEFAAYCIRNGTRGLPGGPLCQPQEIPVDGSGWRYGVNIGPNHLREHFREKGRFIGPRSAIKTSGSHLARRVQYEDLGAVVHQGYYVKLGVSDDEGNYLPGAHSALFIRWCTLDPGPQSTHGFDPEQSTNTFLAIGGNQSEYGTVSVDRYTVSTHGKPGILWSDQVGLENEDGFGKTD
jgi:hypothetical protein